MSKKIKNIRIVRENRFRTPTPLEHAVGIWVDRVGRGTERVSAPDKRRLLGQYGLVRIIEGTGTLFVDDSKEIPIQTGDVMCLFPDLPVFYTPSRDNWTTEWVVWNCGENTADFVDCLPASRINPVLKGAGADVGRSIARLRDIMSKENRTGALRRASLLLDMLAKLAEVEPRGACDKGGRDDIDKTVDFINRFFGQPLPVETLASRAGMSPGAFRQAFKQQTGRTPKKHISAIRLARAKEMLENGLSIKETAIVCGYSDVFHFMHAFKANTGMTAREFAVDSGLNSSA
ncbi:MAG: AraC family transcriptional regulator [Lentisphaeria bacterium]|nr:AraC family transcriptional regulator [Lentisphaeria bacterium]